MSTTIPHDDFEIRPFRPAIDLPAVKQIWRECGWISHETDEHFVEDFFSAGDTHIAALDGIAECACHMCPGTMRHQHEDLRMAVVTAVTTGRVARKRGLGKATAAHALAAQVANGVEVATVGVFEQGFYDQLGFGGGSYEQIISFDPSDLKELPDHRIPRRLRSADWKSMHRAMSDRWIGHGGRVLTPAVMMKAKAGWLNNGFGLGYFNDHSELTHFFYGHLENEHGPLRIAALAYQTGEQLLELMSLLRSLSDQVSQVAMIEPPHLHLQDLLAQPFRLRRLSQSSEFASSHHAASFWQVRMLNICRCLHKTHLYGTHLEFNLVLDDPIAMHLPDPNAGWTGLSGEYLVTLDEDSSARRGNNPELPTLHATVNAFTRMWLGIRPASELAISDKLSADTELLEELDHAFRLPAAKLGWYL